MNKMQPVIDAFVEDREADEYETKPVRACPVCGSIEFPKMTSSFFKCRKCGWFDDMTQEMNPDEDNCGNIMSLNQAKAAYKRGDKVK